MQQQPKYRNLVFCWVDYFRLLANWIHEQSCPLAELSALWKLLKSYFQFASKSWADLLNWDIILSKNMIKETENTKHENLFIQCHFSKTKNNNNKKLLLCKLSYLYFLNHSFHLWVCILVFGTIPIPSCLSLCSWPLRHRNVKALSDSSSGSSNLL